jgi:uncharacterized RDD family membrane protein YckC
MSGLGTFRAAADLTAADLPPDATTPVPPAGDEPAMQRNLSASDHATSEASTEAPSAAYANVDSWRVEVAARLERYRIRRKPKSPRYPSLLLPFDSPESWSRPAASTAAQSARDFAFEQDHELAAAGSLLPIPRGVGDEVEVEDEDESGFARAPQPQKRHRSAEPERMPERYSEPVHESFANVIEFPRSAALPVIHRSELAEPIFDRPRIVEAPEILPPPPALGGMLIEAARTETVDERADFASPLSSASISHRMLAALVDGAILLLALAGFGFIFLRWNPAFSALISTPSLSQNLIHGPLPIIAGVFAALAIVLWIAYEFLFTVYTGATPGLRAAHLKLAAFDGSPLNRRARRWRVLASFLSAFSAGLGYLWSFLDQDGLCWHDRITHTHVQPSR